MIKYKVAIVDDEEDARALVKIHLHRHENLQTIGEAQNGLEAIQLIEKQQPDIVLLDIQMPELNGLDLIARIKQMPHFIFITAYDQFAVKAFELHAVDYLLKPFSAKRFDEAVQRAVQLIRQGKIEQNTYQTLLETIKNHKSNSNPEQFLKHIIYKSGSKTHYIPTDEILLIEAADQYVNIFTSKKKFLIRQSMDYLEEQLNPDIFIRTHRSFIIRLSEVDAIEQYQPRNLLIHLKNGRTAKLSKSKKQLLQEKLRIG